MSAPIFIGDALSAAGFRLAGAQTLAPEDDDVTKALQRALTESELVLMTAEYAQRVPESILLKALSAEHPTFVLVPDVRELVAPPDLAMISHRTLGLAS